MPKEGLLLQTDGSRHDWLGGRGPRLTLVGAIDDATGRVTAATFRDEEDSAGYLEVLAGTIRRYGVPGAIYHDRHGIFEPSLSAPLTLEEQLVDRRVPTQLGRAFAELGIGSISARSPQAKGRVERLWGTLQDRLVSELRIAGIEDRDGANRYLARYLARHNRRFASRPPIRCRPGVPCQAGSGSSVSAASSTGAPWPGTAPCARARRSSSCQRRRTGAAGPVSASSSICASTAGWSSGMAPASCSRRRPRSMPSSSERSAMLASRWGPWHRPLPGRGGRPPAIPGVDEHLGGLDARGNEMTERTDSLSS
jgi:hypothetical protein